MSINKPTGYLLTTMIVLMAVLQISQAQTASVTKNNATFDHIVNIIDPALIAGTEVLLKDLI